MDNNNPPKNNPKGAELFMECEEEELEPWQKKAEETSDDDELIFVKEISNSKTAISSNSDELQSLSSMSTLLLCPPDSKSTDSIATQDYTGHLQQTHLDDSSDLRSDLTQDAVPESPSISNILPEGCGQTSPELKVPSTSKENSVNPVQPNTSEIVCEVNPSASVSLMDRSSEAPSQSTGGTGTADTSSSQDKTGKSVLKACPKCNSEFSLLEPLKFHMKHCCPDMVNNFLELKVESSHTEDTAEIAPEKEKLIMLVSDFYYGTHEGDTEAEPKTYTTFKCVTCCKVLKNNIRFMNHMKHHLELDKQNSKSWESHTTCQHCYRKFSTPFQLQCHIENTHTRQEVSTTCKICELSFETEHVLLQHMKDTHKPGEMPYICKVCQFRSSTFSDVETHFRTSHDNTKNLLCPFCLKVSKMATPYANHYMKHQTVLWAENHDEAAGVSGRKNSRALPKSEKKGIQQCTKCRLQFLTCKEKMDHKIEHRTFIKPRELEGLPPGAKITIRASFEHLPSREASTSSSPQSASVEVSPPQSKNSSAESLSNANSSKSKTSAASPTANKPSTSKPGVGTAKDRKKSSYKHKTRRNRKNAISIALKNLRYPQGIHKCIECRSQIKDFVSHFCIYSRCTLCKYNTNCQKAFINHMTSHASYPSKQLRTLKKHSGASRGITLVCLKCDFLTNSSSLDQMAKHLNRRRTHTCQVIIENVTESTSTSEPTSQCRSNTEISKNVQGTPGQCPPSMDTPDACSLFPRNVNYLTVRPLVRGLKKVRKESPLLPDWPPIRLMLIWPEMTSEPTKLSTTSH
nr:zinc finger protein 280C isoform X2 [Oryctolagus cuniculus]